MRTFPALVVATILGFASLSHAGGVDPVPDLTGTWTGNFVCKGISTSPVLFGDFNFVDKEATLEITQSGGAPAASGVIVSGDNLIASLEANDPDFAVALSATMCGPVVVNPAKPKQVRAGLVAGFSMVPGTSFAVDFSTVKVFPANGKGVTGKLTGKGVLIFGGFGGGTSGSCKWSFERTDDTPPIDPPLSCNEGDPM